MKHNVGGFDRTGRIVIGIVLAVAALASAHVAMGWRIGALVIAAIALITAGARYCPVNQALGINTAEGKEAAKK